MRGFVPLLTASDITYQNHNLGLFLNFIKLAILSLGRRWLVMVVLGLLVGCNDRKSKSSVPAAAHNSNTPVVAQALPVAIPAAEAETLPSLPPPSLPTVALPTAASKKLAGPLFKALQLHQQQQPAAGRSVTRMPDIPIQDGDRVLVDLEATVSQDLLDQIARLGGRIAPNPASGQQLRVFIPLAQMEALAARADVSAISVATVIASSRMLASPPAPAAAPTPAQ